MLQPRPVSIGALFDTMWTLYHPCVPGHDTYCVYLALHITALCCNLGQCQSVLYLILCGLRIIRAPQFMAHNLLIWHYILQRYRCNLSQKSVLYLIPYDSTMSVSRASANDFSVWYYTIVTRLKPVSIISYVYLVIH